MNFGSLNTEELIAGLDRVFGSLFSKITAAIAVAGSFGLAAIGVYKIDSLPRLDGVRKWFDFIKTAWEIADPLITNENNVMRVHRIDNALDIVDQFFKAPRIAKHVRSIGRQ
jgi:hypothetical protein